MTQPGAIQPTALPAPVADGVADPAARTRDAARTPGRAGADRHLIGRLQSRRHHALLAAVALLVTSAGLVLANPPADAPANATRAAHAQAPAEPAQADKDSATSRGATETTKPTTKKDDGARDRATDERSRPAARGTAGSDRGSSAPQSRSSENGYAPSAYTGRYYRAGYEPLRQCIVHRESRGDYAARNQRSGASGAYQFMLRTSNEVARRMGHPELVGRPAGTWSKALQDEAFFTLYDHGRGISHWGGGCR